MGYHLQGITGDWEVVIGLEVHAQVISNSKLFSGAATAFGAEPNSQVAFIDAGFPGMLPVINRMCVEQAVRTGLGLKAQINLTSVFARKNYFYPDLPQGYQISQYDLPIVGNGILTISLPDGTSKAIGIERLHLEQDAGKSLHDQHPTMSFIDLNRSGVALMEIVSKPDLRSPEEAGLYLTKLRSILRYLGTCDGNMQEGSLRCDANVSVRPKGAIELRTRCEIKNVNSIRFVQQAIEYEARRHIEVYETGGTIAQETRLFDAAKGETRSMRSKEQAHDYRYFPDPDLLPLILDPAMVEAIKVGLPELPDEKRDRFINEYGLNVADADVLVADRASASYFEQVAKGRDAKLAANWVMGDLFGALNASGCGIENPPITAADLGGLVDLIADGTLSGRLAKDVFAIMVQSGQDAATIVRERGLRQVTDTNAIDVAVDAVLAANADKVAEIKAGKQKLIGWLVGQVIRSTDGKANPAAVNKSIIRRLS